jgi:arylsulfatase A
MKNKLSRRSFLKVAGGSLGGLCLGFACVKPTQKKPNIIFIMADDLGYGDLGCYGSTQIPTPNIDKLAAEGKRFTDAHAPAAVCTPTRYGVLTGRYSWRSKMKRGVLRGYDPLLIETSRTTVASMLKEQGYGTACVGKWHLGLGAKKPTDFSMPLRPGPLDVGFDYFFGIPASLDMPPYCFVENDQTVGELSVEKNPYNTLQRKGPMVPGWKDEEVGPTFTKKATQFIERHVQNNKENPFFLYMPYHAPHTPCTPPDFIKGNSSAGVRGDMVTELDWMLSEIIKTLKENNLAENTLLFLTSDNGALTVGPESWAGESLEKYDLAHNGHKPNGALRGQKSDTYDGGHREPFLAWWPGNIKAGTISDELICLTDLMATCAAIVNIDLPADAGEDSYNILPALLGKNKTPIREAIVHHSGKGIFSIRKASWKLILGRGSGGFSAPGFIEPKEGEALGQLYNLEIDPAEKNNVWSAHPDKVKELTNLLEKYKQQGHSRSSV